MMKSKTKSIVDETKIYRKKFGKLGIRRSSLNGRLTDHYVLNNP